jgi:hypothetical protein
MIQLDGGGGLSYVSENLGGSMLKKFATQLDGPLLEELRKAAQHEGRQVQSLVNEAIRAYLQAKREGLVRPNILHAVERSTGEFGSLYKALIGKG